MNNKVKFALASLTAAASLIGYSAHAQLALNAVIDKIELVADADDYFGTARTVYEPDNRIGANETRTIDLFDRTNGVRLPLQKPDQDIYPTALIHFSTLEISGTTAQGVENILDDAVTDGSMFDYEGHTVLVLGDIGGGAAGSVDAEVMGAAGTGNISMQPVTVATTSFQMPELNIGLPASKAGSTASSVALLGLPQFQTVARNVDNADIGDVTVQVESIVFDGAGSTDNEFVMGQNRVSVGLFDPTLPAKPAYFNRYRPAGNVEAGDLEDIVFYDVPEGFNFVPLAWYDENNNRELDAGEFVTAHDFAIADAQFPMDADGIDYTADGFGELHETPVAFNDREFDLVIAMAAADVAASLTNDAAAVSSTLVADFAINAGSDETPGTLSALLTINNGVADIEVPVVFGSDGAGDTALIQDMETMYVVLEDADAFDVAGASYDAGAETLTVAGIVADITTIGAASEYSVDLSITDLADGASAYTTQNGAPTVLAVTQVGNPITGGEVAPAVGSLDVGPIAAD